MSYNQIKTLEILDAFWFQTFFLMLLLSLRSPISGVLKKMANKWPSHFHKPQKWTIDLLFKIMESKNTWQILRNPLPTPLLYRYHKCMFPFWFFKIWSVTCLNTNGILILILWKFSQFIFCQAIKETKQVYISYYISYFLNNFLVTLCQ